MSRQDTDQGPVPTSAIAAYFPEEEWKLLHDWQKDLYRNVMNEIHQALLSLGPLIATSVLSLKAKGKELCVEDRPDSERTCIADHSLGGAEMAVMTPRDLMSVKKESATDPVEGQDSATTENMASSAGESTIITARISFNVKEEGDSCCMDLQDSQSGGNSPRAFPVFNTEPERSFIDHVKGMGGECSSSSDTGVNKPVISAKQLQANISDGPYSCKQCGRSFSHKRDIMNHHRIHAERVCQSASEFQPNQRTLVTALQLVKARPVEDRS
ncbi:hypothetical protein NDU88_000245 [Pleurodeles waltl]|uniref:C2H2-type domain-containing protein n=1 Tax=Pleurodeles waltl TaxID=8319 RepID=A0AAV7VVX4_PLEWA|nr:hypothetical protein NDU88_000245 [Pleurodeles waltl]